MKKNISTVRSTIPLTTENIAYLKSLDYKVISKKN